MPMEYLYDETERPITRFVSFVTDTQRYDFAVTFTKKFQGSSLVVCIQTLKAVLLSANDVSISTQWLEKLSIHPEDYSIVKQFFQNTLYPAYGELTQISSEDD